VDTVDIFHSLSVNTSTFTRDEQWTLSQTGNWHSRLLDLNGDGDGLDANEFTDAGTFNTANELTQRSLTGGVTATYTTTHDAVGNLTNLPGGDGKDYRYEYDAFGRLIRVRNRSTEALVAEYTSNGLGFRTSWKYDADASGTVDGSDPVYWFTHDERWRIVATYRGSDTDPREVFVWHSAGMDGGGGSSYIDSIVLRQDDTTTAWTAAPDTLNRRVYPLQNWRADVVAVYDLNEGIIAERVRYSAYGVPFCVAAADFDADGDVDAADNTAYSNANTAGDPSADLNLDNVVDFNDTLAWNNLYNAAETGGRSVLSRSSVRNRIGYAGYQHDPSITGSAQASGQGKYHVRHRVYDAGIGRWTRRDPAGFTDSMSLYGYGTNLPQSQTDQLGLSVQGKPLACLIGEVRADTLSPGQGACDQRASRNCAVGYARFRFGVFGPWPCPENYAWIVQGVMHFGSIRDCTTGQITGTPPPTYYEAWRVEQGSAFADDHRWELVYPGQTTGSSSRSSIANAILACPHQIGDEPSTWSTTTVPWAGGLRATYTQPAWFAWFSMFNRVDSGVGIRLENCDATNYRVQVAANCNERWTGYKSASDEMWRLEPRLPVARTLEGSCPGC
jgi:RHS repeat-associated protein